MRPTLHFAGYAEQVLDHYHAALGGETEVVRYGGSFAEAEVPADWTDKLLYSRLRTPYGDLDIMDAPPGRENPVGGNLSIQLEIEAEDRAADVFAKLADGGTVDLPFGPTPFARKFGMTHDRFGTAWLVSVPSEVALTSSR